MSHADKLLLAAAALGPGEEDRTSAAEDVVEHAADQLASARLEPLRRSLDEQVADAPTAAFGGDSDALDEIDRDFANDFANEVQAPPIVPVDLDREPPRRTRAERGALRWPLSRLQTGMLALALLDVILVGWRTDVVRALPQTASFYSLIGLPVNLRGLVFDSVATVTEQHEGVPILVVEGNVINTTRRNEDVPRLKFILRNAAQHEIYSWTAVPVRASLSPGEGEGFRTRLASPPADARDVVVRFVNRRDMVAANR